MEDQNQRMWCCPDEVHAVSRSIHLARLAAGYPACVNCPDRFDASAIPLARQRLDIAAERHRTTIFQPNGVRGLFPNEITRESMSRLGGAVANSLWESSVRQRVLLPPHRRRSGSGEVRNAVGPRVVVGHDHRRTSPELAVALVQALRRFGCAVSEIGCVHRPILDYAIDHVHADAGLLVTGGGSPGDWNGLDVAGTGGVTWSLGGKLESVRTRWEQPLSRPTRSLGPYRSVSVIEGYAASLPRYFHALRPLRVTLLSASPQVLVFLESVRDRVPGRWTVQPAPVPFGDHSAPPDSLINRLSDSIHREHLDLGVLISADGRGCFILDERGEMLTPVQMLRVLAASNDDIDPQAQSDRHVEPVCPADSTEESLIGQLLEQSLPLVTDGQGRYWLAHCSPHCDALITLAHALQFFSRSDQPPSMLLQFPFREQH